ncbi:efflux pump antibiotic resistance protein [Trematosphaeria pertusa]|uniref:Efflux pump antibiotic resistance protein n=1 Tax=Trematosphaeria pertusa TaxID=390896 RepID=A0A6A6HXP9_9PLEO|nr:efflux pump antibiotic resistance protein [Trematosphaeria pertusa]KAF2242512.1 efflux pump antibiotic resistance protein [Trematosphaeria pertusa]
MASEPKIPKRSSEHVSQDLEFITIPGDALDRTPKTLDSVSEKGVGTAPSPNAAPQKPMARGSWSLALVTLSLALGTFLIALDTTIVGIAIPTITTQFHSLDDIAWYGSAYLITLTALQPSFGRIYKLYSVKNTYLACVAVFEVGSIICASAPRSAVFIVGRAIAGCGAAGLFQGALNIITNTVPLQKRPQYMGIVISVFGISACVGPVLGGAFTQGVSWRWCFWVNVPIGAFTFFLVLIFLKHKEDKPHPGTILEQMKQLDPIGAATIIAAVCCLFLALQWGGHSKPWKSATIIGLFIGFGMLFFFFCFAQYKMGENATTPLRVLRQRSILFGALFLFSSAMSAYVYGYYLPIYFQSIKGSSPTKSGLQFMALALPQIFALILAGALTTKWGHYVPYMIVGTAINVVGSGFLITLDTDTPTLKWAAYMVVTGIGTGIGVNLPYTAVQVVLPEIDIPLGNAISQFAYQLGASIGLAVGQTLFLNQLTSELSKRTSLVSPAAVIAAGASDLQRLAPTPELLRILLESYASAIRHALIFALAVVCLAFAFTFGMEHRNVKTAAEKGIVEGTNVQTREEA